MDPQVTTPAAAPPGRSRGLHDLLGAVAVSTVVTLPVFLVGSLAVQIRPDLHFNAATLGLVVACYYATAAAASVPAGQLAERVGGVRVMRVAALVSALALGLVAGVVRTWPALVAALILAGVASSAVQPAANLFLSRRVDARHQGLAFGIKQSAVPLAALLGGLAVPSLALTAGWRWAFAVAAVLAVGASLAVPRPRRPLAVRRTARPPRPRPEPVRPLAALAAGFGLALMACTSLGAFLVTSAVGAGIGRGAAGLLAALASCASLGARVIVGLLADRRQGRHFPVVAGMIGVGAIGFLLLAAGALTRLVPLLVAGALLAYGAGWGWNGLFNFAVVRTHSISPARATGVTQTGGRVGGMIGPLVFGLLAVHLSFAVAWGVAAAEALAGAGLILIGRRLLQASRAQRRPGTDEGSPPDVPVH